MGTETATVPIVGSLTDEEFRRREREVIERLMPLSTSAAETDTGYSFSFPHSRNILSDIAEFITLERECCPFLDFDLSLGTSRDDILLSLSGPAGAKEFISRTFVR